MKYKMCDVVERVHGNVDRFNTDLKYYVAGEQFECRELIINKKGLLTPTTVNLLGFKFHFPFKAGDVLFMARSPHLRKAGMVTFDGICSDASYILRTKDENILMQRFLPFIVQSDLMWNYFDSHKTGSVNPLLNWKDFSQFEFELPPIEEQRRIATLLWAVERTRQAYRDLLVWIDELVKSQFVEMFGDPVDNPMNWPSKPLTSMGVCKNGMNFHAGDSGVDINCLGVGDFKDYSVIDDTSKLPLVSLNAMPDSEYLLQDGDIVFVRSNGNKALVGRSVAVFPGKNPTTFSGFCIRFRLADITAVQMEYLLQVLKTDSIRKKMQGRGANIQNLNQQILSSLDIPLPPNDLQEQFINFIKQTDKSKLAIRKAIESLEKSRNVIMKSIFG